MLTAAADNLELAEVRDANPGENDPQTPQPATAVLLIQARERNRAATEALAEAERDLERSRDHLVLNPGRPSQAGVEWARTFLQEAQEEAAASAAAVRVYAARAEKEEAAAARARVAAVLDRIREERAAVAEKLNREQAARAEWLERAKALVMIEDAAAERDRRMSR